MAVATQQPTHLLHVILSTMRASIHEWGPFAHRSPTDQAVDAGRRASLLDVEGSASEAENDEADDGEPNVDEEGRQSDPHGSDREEENGKSLGLVR